MNMGTNGVSFNGTHRKQFSNGESKKTTFTNDIEILERLKNKVEHGALTEINSYTKTQEGETTGDKLEFKLNGNVNLTLNKDIADKGEGFDYVMFIGSQDESGTKHELEIRSRFNDDENIKKKLAAVTDFIFSKIESNRQEETTKNNQAALDVLG